MRLEQTFGVDRPPEVVFDYMTDASNLAQWQTSKTLRQFAKYHRLLRLNLERD